MTRHWSDDRRVRSVLRDGEFLHLGVDGRHGPHVTPQVFSHSTSHSSHRDDDLWVLTPRRSTKVDVIRKRRRVAALVRDGRQSVVLTGRATLVDPLRGRGIGTGTLLDLPLAAGSYLGRNLGHALGILRASGPDPTLLVDRVAIRVEPRCVALLDGADVVGSWGRWEQGTANPATAATVAIDDRPPVAPPVDLVPGRLRRLLEGDGVPAVVGWPTAAGFATLPAAWDGGSGTLAVATAALELVAAGPASMTVYRGGTSLDSKRGVMVRGRGRVVGTDGPWTRLAVDAERVTWWRGDRSRTTPVAGTVSALEDLPPMLANS